MEYKTAPWDLSEITPKDINKTFKTIERHTNNIFKKKKINPKKKDPNIQHLEKSIIEKIGINVSIKTDRNNKGTITFSYNDLNQLNKLIEIIKSNY